MRLNNVKRVLAAKRFNRAKLWPEWVRKRTDKKVKHTAVSYRWRSQKLKV